MNGNRSARKYQVLSSSKTHRTLAALSAATGMVAWAAVSKADTYGNDYGGDSGLTNLGSSSAWVDETSPTTDSPPPGASDIAQFVGFRESHHAGKAHVAAHLQRRFSEPAG